MEFQETSGVIGTGWLTLVSTVFVQDESWKV